MDEIIELKGIYKKFMEGKENELVVESENFCTRINLEQVVAYRLDLDASFDGVGVSGGDNPI